MMPTRTTSCKALLATIAATTAIAWASLDTTPAKAQQNFDIAFVDIERVLKETTAWRKFLAKFEKDRQKLQKQAQDLQTQSRTETQELLKIRDKLSPANLRKEQQKLQTRRREFEQEISQADQALKKRYTDAQTQLSTAIERVAADVARENNVPIVVNRALLVYASDSLNMTAKVIKRLNKQLKKITPG